MLAQMGDQPFENEHWVHEPKLDGYRIHAHVHEREARLVTRGNADYTAYFPLVAAELGKLPWKSMVLDGEIVAFDETGRPSFSALQALTSQTPGRGAAPTVLFCFDLLHVDGICTRGQPYLERRQMLTQAIQQSDRIQLVHSDRAGPALFDSIVAMDMEGMIAKRTTSIYQPGVRSADWLKILAFKRADLLVVGFTGLDRVDSLLVGYRRNGKLIYAGEVNGLGALATSLLPVLEAVPAAPPLARGRVRWIAPMISVEVKYREVMKGGKLRHPVFYRLSDRIVPPIGDFPEYPLH